MRVGRDGEAAPGAGAAARRRADARRESPTRARRRRARAGALSLLAGLLACGAPVTDRVERPAGYVGGAVCAGCHAAEAARWRGSQHDLAMQEAGPESVLGDFGGASLEHYGERFHFERRDGGYVVHAAGADGTPRAFEVAYTFGVEPLQQLLVRLPGGRLQAVGVAWDARPAAEGGQRWFHLHPDEPVPPGDVLHWTGPAGSWNAMCAECHSTKVSIGYRPEDGSYATTWSEIDVSCEACHGAGSAHVAWAERAAESARGEREADTGAARLGLGVGLGEQRAWRFAAGSAIARRVPAPGSSAEIETCARCHARRTRIAPDPGPGTPFLDAYRPALLEAGLYHADGQILDEVYTFGSFLQSRMYASGVVCSDCHDPHALRIEAPDAVCAGCHATAVFAAPSHHRHREGSAGASCVACHMPARTYMVVDARRDHSFRVPRPDLTLAIGVPNACAACHADRPASWAAAATARWRGDGAGPPPTHFGEILDAGRRRAPGAAETLARLIREPAQPAILRATALSLLAEQPDAASAAALREGLRDPDALVRMAAVAAAEPLAPPERLRALGPLLRDPLRAVRIEAGRALAPLRGRADAPTRDALDAALEGYRASQALHADQPAAHVNLGILDMRLGALDAAQRAFERALRLGPFFVPAAVNLADVHRLQGRDDAGERVLRALLERVPESADAHHALGLLLVRRGRRDAALAPLGRAAALAPESPRYAYVHALALEAAGARGRALAALHAAHEAHPDDPELLLALATLHRDAGDLEAARRAARALLELRPADPLTRALVGELEAEAR